MNLAALKPAAQTVPSRAGVLLPLRLSGTYDYITEQELPRGSLVTAQLGPREYLGVVWGAADGAVDASKLKRALPLPGGPRLPEGLCDFIDWVARYTLTSPGLVLALALRVPQAFEAESSRAGYVRADVIPARMTPARKRVLDVAADGLARKLPALAEEANASSSVIRGLIDAGALNEARLPEFNSFGCPDPAFQPAILNLEQEAAARTLRGAVASERYSVSLLDGVTGSGKTETYFEAVTEALHRGMQTLSQRP